MNSQKITVLVIDDEPDIAKALLPSLKLSGYEITTAETASAGIELVRKIAPELIILDLGLPDMDGKDAILKIREITETPIIVLSARHMESEKVAALDLGANDYVDKPFALAELLARMRVAVRMSGRSKKDQATFVGAGLTVDFAAHKVVARGTEVHLTPKEFVILQILARHADQVVTQNQLLETAWAVAEKRDSQTLRVTIKNLRQKIEANPSEPSIILTIPSVGYRLQSGDID